MQQTPRSSRPRLILFPMALLMLTLWAVLVPNAAKAATPDIDTPPELEEWVDWVLHKHPSLLCPTINNAHTCVWPGTLSISADETSGTFEMTLKTDSENRVQIPGAKGAWPQEVRVDGQSIPVLLKQDRPWITVPKGIHRVKGKFNWTRMPNSLPIPRDVARVKLRLNGETIDYPELEGNAAASSDRRALRLGAGQITATEENSIELDVGRLIHDGVPVQITSRFEIRASGQSREVNLGTVLLPNTKPVDITADIPARFNHDGEFIVQVRPGNFTVTVEAIHDGPVSALTAQEGKSPWPKNEFWAFQSDETVRSVKLDGPMSVDPARTPLPADWHEHATFAVSGGETLTFTNVRRGEPTPAPNQIRLSREFWLDINGSGLTIRDTFSGQMHQQWRLNMLAPAELGHLTDHGVEQVITVDKDDANGAETRNNEVRIVAESRVDKRPDTLPAVGWNTDVQQLNATLYLPPGWTVLDGLGVDNLTGSILDQWSLFDLFFVLILSMVVGKLLGWPWGLVALVGLTLSQQEVDAPAWTWALLLLLTALKKAISNKNAQMLVSALHIASAITLFVVLGTFGINQIQTGLFPSLGTPSYDSYGMTDMVDRYAEIMPEEDYEDNFFSEGDEPNMQMMQQNAAPAAPPVQKMREKRAKKSMKHMEQSVGGYGRKGSPNVFLSLQQDPNSLVQTGPGIPNWHWNQQVLEWSGPVTQEHKFQLFLLSPTINLVLSFIRVLLLFALAIRLLDRKSLALPGAQANMLIWLVPALFATASMPAHAEETPSTEILSALEQRLLEAPSCKPNCVSTSHLEMEIDKGSNEVTITGKVHAETAVGWPIPGPTQTWVPRSVSIDGNTTHALRRHHSDGLLYVRLKKGVHTVRATGPLPSADSIMLQLGSNPQWVEIDAPDWEVSGIRADGSADAAIQITREAQSEPSDSPSADQSEQALTPWLEVHRSLDIGIPWRIQTRVTRAGANPFSQPEASIAIRVPLLDGERITGEQVEVIDGEAAVTLDRGTREVSWISTLETQDQLLLKAPMDVPWTETWSISCSPIFQCQTEESESFAPLHHTQDGLHAPIWQPWPGETVTLSIQHPKAIQGQTLTIDRADLVVKLGRRLSQSTLELELRSSQGGQQSITLPAGAEVQEVRIDGKDRVIQQKLENGRPVVAIPYKPGAETVHIAWEEPNGVDLVSQVGAVDLGHPAANTKVTVKPPQRRWILASFGPKWGPVLLYWSSILIVLLAAPLLARIPYAPLKTHHWALLCLGMTQLPVAASAVVVLWFAAMGLRSQRYPKSWATFDCVQIALAGWTLVAILCLFAAIQYGLLQPPDLQVQGNGSSESALKWTDDAIFGPLPRPTIVSLPVWVWHVVMLCWSLWLAAMMMRWGPWAWRTFSTGGVFQMPSRPEGSSADKTAPASAPTKDNPTNTEE